MDLAECDEDEQRDASSRHPRDRAGLPPPQEDQVQRVDQHRPRDEHGAAPKVGPWRVLGRRKPRTHDDGDAERALENALEGEPAAREAKLDTGRDA